MSKKRRRLYQRIQFGKRKREGDVEKLIVKRRKLDKGEAEVGADGIIRYNN